MSKKIRDEELIKTHVININEIREAEKEENQFKVKCLPRKFVIVGAFLIATGLALPGFKNLASAETNASSVAMKNVNKNRLTCISNINLNESNVKVYSKITYVFKNNKLLRTSKNVRLSNITGNDLTNLSNIKAFLDTTYVSNNMITYNIYSSNKSVVVNEIIDDYNTFDT